MIVVYTNYFLPHPADATVAQVAIAWLLHKPMVASVVIGARTASQLSDNLQSAHLKLSQEEVMMNYS